MLSKNPGVVDDVNYGVYIWRDAQGRAVVDDEFNYMMIPSKKGDFRKIKLLQDAARAHGIMDGQAEFVAGSRPISQEEWEMQTARARDGLVPDEYDLGNLIDEYRYQKELDERDR
jgi:hypothetical protein